MYLVWINPPTNFTFSDDSVFLKKILAGDIISLNLLVFFNYCHKTMKMVSMVICENFRPKNSRFSPKKHTLTNDLYHSILIRLYAYNRTTSDLLHCQNISMKKITRIGCHGNKVNTW